MPTVQDDLISGKGNAMTVVTPSIVATALQNALYLPEPVSGQRFEIASSSGRLAYYSANPPSPSDAPPLLLVHSVNAAASAYEVMPIYERLRSSRTVYALELPGFGHSERGERKYTIRMMTDAIHAVVAEIRKKHHDAAIDALALSLSSEFMARAVSEFPSRFRSVAVVSPSGFNRRMKEFKWRDGTRGKPGLRNFLEFPLWSRGFFRLLTSRAGIAYFLKKSWGADTFDQGLADYDYLTTRQPGAQHAPYYFVSGFLFSQEILSIYQSLTLPVWMAHGVRGDFVNYKNKHAVEQLANWQVDVFQTGALPHFEVPDQFVQAYEAFLRRAGKAAGGQG